MVSIALLNLEYSRLSSSFPFCFHTFSPCSVNNLGQFWPNFAEFLIFDVPVLEKVGIEKPLQYRLFPRTSTMRNKIGWM